MIRYCRNIVVTTHVDGSCGGLVFTSICLCVRLFFHTMCQKTDVPEMFQDESWKLGVQRSRSRVTKTFAGVGLCTLVSAGLLHCEGSAPVITEAPMNMTVVAGDSVRFECVATGAPSPSTSWSRGESHLIPYEMEISQLGLM